MRLDENNTAIDAVPRANRRARPGAADATETVRSRPLSRAADAVVAAGPAAPPQSIYIGGQGYLRLGQQAPARAQFDRLAAGDPSTPWALVGQSATAQIDGNTAVAIDAAQRAVNTAPGEFYANYQLGLALAAAEQWAPAAAAFEAAATIDPAFAYAHYYAGLAYSKVKRVDQMAQHFEYFLRLAPTAPERPAVTSLMRSVR